MERSNSMQLKPALLIALLALFTVALVLFGSVAYAADMPVPADEKLVQSLLPGYEMVEGIMDGEHEMLLLMKNKEGELVFVGGVYDESKWSWTLTESTPLPKGTILGVENFTHSLGIPGDYYYVVDVNPFSDGSWGATLMYPDDEELFQLGQNWISCGVNPLVDGGVVGAHPWSDITKMDWLSLPENYEESLTMVDRSGWAMVNNANPADRLNLREKNDQNSGSIGKYYNGTPVRVISRGDVWTEVEICGIHGYMMTQYLAFGDEMDNVEFACQRLMTKENAQYLTVYDSVHEHRRFQQLEMDANTGFYVIGVLWDEWYHVWFYDLNMGGYVLQSDLWEGNG